MPILFTLCYYDSLVTWTVVSLTAAKFKPLIFSVSGFALPYATKIVILMILYDLCLFPVQLLYNRIHTEGWKPCANRWLVCTLDNFQWCGEPVSNSQAGQKANRLLFFHYILTIWWDTDREENTASKNSIVACVFIATGTRLLSSCLATLEKGHTDSQVIW
jgi:hypothetical protein